MGVAVTFLGRHEVEPSGLGFISGHAPATVIHPAESEIPVWVSLLGGAAVPAKRLGMVLRHPSALKIPVPKVGLSRWVFAGASARSRTRPGSAARQPAGT